MESAVEVKIIGSRKVWGGGTYKGGKNSVQRSPKLKLAPYEHGVGNAMDVAEGVIP